MGPDAPSKSGLEITVALKAFPPDNVCVANAQNISCRFGLQKAVPGRRLKAAPERAASRIALPIRSPEAFVERLRWCDTHRVELAKMVRHLYDDFRPRTWADVARDFESLCAEPATIHGR
jgi:hypothetical protein